VNASGCAAGRKLKSGSRCRTTVGEQTTGATLHVRGRLGQDCQGEQWEGGLQAGVECAVSLSAPLSTIALKCARRDKKRIRKESVCFTVRTMNDIEKLQRKASVERMCSEWNVLRIVKNRKLEIAALKSRQQTSQVMEVDGRIKVGATNALVEQTRGPLFYRQKSIPNCEGFDCHKQIRFNSILTLL
jgi:hypothetical protein